MALKHPLLAEVRQIKRSMEKGIGVGHVEQGKGDNRFELYSYLSHLLSIAKLEADKRIKTLPRQEESEEALMDLIDQGGKGDW